MSLCLASVCYVCICAQLQPILSAYAFGMYTGSERERMQRALYTCVSGGLAFISAPSSRHMLGGHTQNTRVSFDHDDIYLCVGIIIDIGHSSCQIATVIEGYLLESACSRVRHLSGTLSLSTCLCIRFSLSLRSLFLEYRVISPVSLPGSVLTDRVANIS